MSKNTSKSSEPAIAPKEPVVSLFRQDPQESTAPDAAPVPTKLKAGWSGLTAIFAAVVIYFTAVLISSTALALFARANHWSSAYADNWVHSSIVAQFFYVLINEAITI